MKRMKSYSFTWKDENGNTHYDAVVAENFSEALNTKYPNGTPDFSYISSSEVDVVLPNE